MEGRPGGPGGTFGSTEGAYIKITGGEIKVSASGDGIDSNGDFYMEGGTVIDQRRSEGYHDRRRRHD